MKNLAFKTVRGGAWGKTSSRVIIAHGLLGNSSNWATVSHHLAEHDLLRSKLHEINMIDMRNHGDSPHVPMHTNAAIASDLEVFALQQQEINPHHDDGGMVLIGHSMGGLALMAALLRRANESALLLPTPEEIGMRCDRGDYCGWRDTQGYAQEMRCVNESMGFPVEQPLLDTIFSCGENTSGESSPGYNPSKEHAQRQQQQHEEVKEKRGPRVKAAIIVDISPTTRLRSQQERSEGVVAILEAMATADLSRMNNFTAAGEELQRAGVSEKAMRDFLLTNLVLGGKTGKSRWRCNLPVLRRDYQRMELELSDWFLNAPAAEESTSTTSSSNNNNSNSSSGGSSLVAPSRCAVPTLFVFGEKSPYNTAEDRRLLDRFFSNAVQAEVAGAGHFVHYENMKGFIEAVAPFLNKHL